VAVDMVGQDCPDDNERLDRFNHCLSQWTTFLHITVFNPDLYCSLQ